MSFLPAHGGFTRPSGRISRSRRNCRQARACGFFVLLFLGYSQIASAGPAQISCTNQTGPPPTVRAEGIAELVGDLVLSCTGGTPTPAGAPVPLANFQVFLNTTVTSRLLAQSGLSEATLLIDEPSPATQCVPQDSRCQPNVFSGTATTSGIPDAKGVLVADSIIWRNVPFDPPGDATRVIRITNVRAKCTPDCVMSIVVTCTQPLVIDRTAITVAVAAPGLVATVAPPTVFQCRPNGGFDFGVTITEGFPGAFRPRIIERVQNVPGTRYGTESGFYAPDLFTATPAVGLADFGTRIRVVFKPVTQGVRLFVPVEVLSGRLRLGLVQTDPYGDSPRLPRGLPPAVPLIAATGNVIGVPVAEVSFQADQAYAVYEVLSPASNVIETATIQVALMFNSNLPNFPPPGPVAVNVSLVPAGGPLASIMTPSVEAPLPRFVDTSVSQTAFVIKVCDKPFTCAAEAVPATVRSEGITELVGDLLLNCTGGVPTKAVAQVPRYNVQISLLNTNITSRIVGSNGLSEATLMIDEPLPPLAARVPVFVPQGTPPPQVLCTPQGNACPILGDGAGTPYETFPGTPTVYSGRQAAEGSVSWNDVPIDAPGAGNTRVIRITNVRANARQLGVSPTLSPSEITMVISVTGSQQVTINNPQQTVAIIQPGLIASGNNINGPAQQCVSQNTPLIARSDSSPTHNGPNFNITVQEGFASSFKRRNIALTPNGTTLPPPWPQNIPGYLYNTESGFYNPALFTATPVVGLADFGTRIRITFNNIQAGTTYFVPTVVPLTTSAGNPSMPPQPPSPVAPGIKQGQMILVQTDQFGNSAPGFTAVAKTGDCGGVPVAPVTATGVAGQGYAVYEVVNSDVNAVETATVPVCVAFIANTSANLPSVGQTTVNVSFAPVGVADSELPRFADTSKPQDAYAIDQCPPPPPFTCAASAVPELVRAEGIAEQVGDLVLNCTGGVPTNAVAQVPRYNVQISLLNTNITSRIVGSNGLSEATLMIDEPLPPLAARVPVFVPQGTPPPQVLCTPQGSACPTVGDGLGTPYETIPGTPTVYPGQQLQVNSTSVIWLGVPIDEPGAGNTRVIRITNVRANVRQLGVSPTLSPTEITMVISVNGSQQVTIENPQQQVTIDNPQQTVAFLQPGLIVGGNNINGPGQQCVSQNTPLIASSDSSPSHNGPNFNITVQEGFASSFKRRNIALTPDGTTLPLPWPQNIPGYPYNTESGFYNPALFTATPAVGLADFGTRIRITFNNIQAGTTYFVPTVVPLTTSAGNSSMPPQPPSPVAPGIKQGQMILVQTDQFGNSAPGFTAVAKTGDCGGVGVAAVTAGVAGQGYAVYEVVNSDVNAVETATVPVCVAFIANTSGNLPSVGQTTVNVSFAPVGGLAASEVPRFADTSKPQDAYAIDPCPTEHPPPPFTCTAAAVPEVVRAEGTTEQVGDLVLNCTGGVPTQAGAKVPLYNVQIFVNTNVTSRIVGNGALSEATLTIDEPLPPPGSRVPDNGVFSGPPPSQVLCTPQGNPCPIVGDGFGTPYETNPMAPTVYSGRLAAVGSVSWNGVPIDAPGAGKTRVIRITNVRANACQLGAGPILLPTKIVMFISVTGSQQLTIDNPQQTVAVILPGLIVDGTTASLSQCKSNNPGLIDGSGIGPFAADFQIRVTEGFPSSFKRRNIALTCDGVTAPAPRAQNIPGYPYNAESGFYNPALFTATPVVGLADFGTRIRIAFNNIGPGVNIFVPVTVSLVTPGTSTATTPAQPVSPVCPSMAPGLAAGQLTLVQTDPFGNSAPGFTAVPAGPVGPGLAQIASNGADSGYAVYEVVNSDVNAIERANINVYVAFKADTSKNLPSVGQTTVRVSFAPAGGPLASIQTADLNAPIPRFCDNSTPRNAFAINSCNPMLSLRQGCAFSSDTATSIAAEGYLEIQLDKPGLNRTGLPGENKGY